MTYFAHEGTALHQPAPVDVGGDDPSGARRLAAAVVARAGIDVQTLANALARGKRAWRQLEALDALAWLLDTQTAAPWSLRWCCDLLDCSAENISARAATMIDRDALRSRLRAMVPADKGVYPSISPDVRQHVSFPSSGGDGAAS